MRDSRHSANTAQTVFSGALVIFLALGMAGNASAGPDRDQAKRIHDRLVGTPPSIACLDQLEAQMPDAKAVAQDAIDNAGGTDKCTDPGFYNVTLKNFITPWTNEEQSVFAPLNDYTATVIGIIRDDRDFREILYGNILYIGSDNISPPYSNENNDHYEAMEGQGANLADPNQLRKRTQTEITNLPDTATAGIITTRAAARAFFIDGTNRAMFRFTLLNHLCTDLEQIKDPTRTHDRIPQDVARSPGGDSRIFMNACVGCHAGMDPLHQALAYYDFEYPDGNPDGGRLVYNTSDVETDNEGESTRVQRKYLINANNFEFGYVVTDDQWENYWRKGPNSVLGWNPTPMSNDGKGAGAKSFGMEFAYSEAFARCQVEKAFKAVCFRPPNDGQTNTLLTTFKGEYNLKDVFTESATYCRGG
ncbi:MAG: hypothetical protein L3J88_14315 [Gammaproteobacteria bacterium]|nr:hypothetical protein [Gammaproteobacteria bacterium]MCF6364487.1 hypothetical protein [Gammaproteobacteria bacterium]